MATLEDIPAVPPRKRHQLEKADPKHLAVWANDNQLSIADRNRAQTERDRRKLLVDRQGTAAVFVTSAGPTPAQIDTTGRLLQKLKPLTILHPYTNPKLHRACVATGAAVEVTSMIEPCDTTIGLVKDVKMPERKQHLEVWADLRAAKDRGAETVVIWPDGSILAGRW